MIAVMNCVIACTMVGCTAVAIGPDACVSPGAVSPPIHQRNAAIAVEGVDQRVADAC